MIEIMIEEYRRVFTQIINEVMKKTGNDFEGTELTLTSALDLALNDKRDEIYK